MTYTCEIKDQAETPVLMIPTRTPVQQLPAVLGDAYGKIMQYLSGLNQTPAGAPYVAYFNMDMNDLEIEVGFPVTRPLPGVDEIRPGHLPAGKIATCLYTGPYNKIAPAYDELAAFITANGQQATGAAYEFYLNDPGETAPQDLQTQIVMPLN